MAARLSTLFRMYRLRTLWPAVCGVLAVTGALPAGPIEEGRQFPELAFPRLDGDELVTLSKYRGKRLLLIHFASW